MMRPLRWLGLIFSLAVLASATLYTQQPPEGRPEGPGFGPGMRPGRPPMERGLRVGPPGRWWTDAALVARLGLTADQQTKIGEIFQSSRLRLIDLSAALQKEEAILEPLLEADPPEESTILLQIDRISQARAGLEKANARMLLGFRGVLSQDQWKKLQAERSARGPRR
ncbi:MAG: periplasmic heavy metal sensor [Candidatus Solibacter usitatus]|nr:periplasmic heavy metal sensor [Candidatus Solibacter usitatus]